MPIEGHKHAAEVKGPIVVEAHDLTAEDIKLWRSPVGGMCRIEIHDRTQGRVIKLEFGIGDNTERDLDVLARLITSAIVCQRGLVTAEPDHWQAVRSLESAQN